MNPNLRNTWFAASLALSVLYVGCSRSQGAQPGAGATPGALRGVENAAKPAPPPPEAPKPDDGLPLAAAELVPGSPAHHGSELYARMCSVCHGASGEGYKADQATMLAQPDFLASVSDQQIGLAIAHGRKGTQMSAWGKEFGGPLSQGDVTALVAFIRTWQHAPAVRLDETAPLGDAARGKAVFERECQSCHGPTGTNVRILNESYLTQVSDGYIRHAIRKGRPPTTMPAFKDTLGNDGIEDILAYLRNLPPLQNEQPAAAAPSEPKPFKPVPQYPKGPAPHGFKAFPEMTSVEVVSAQLKRKAKMLILDARVPSDYEMEHIAGAYNVPFYDPTPFLDKLPKSTWLVAYCGCPHAESGNLARELVKAGFTQVTVLDEGLWIWKERGNPMKKGREP